jgi:hypothetical protein
MLCSFEVADVACHCKREKCLAALVCCRKKLEEGFRWCCCGLATVMFLCCVSFYDEVCCCYAGQLPHATGQASLARIFPFPTLPHLFRFLATQSQRFFLPFILANQVDESTHEAGGGAGAGVGPAGHLPHATWQASLARFFPSPIFPHLFRFLATQLQRFFLPLFLTNQLDESMHGVGGVVGPSHVAVEQEEWSKLPSLKRSRSVNNKHSSKFPRFGKT